MSILSPHSPSEILHEIQPRIDAACPGAIDQVENLDGRIWVRFKKDQEAQYYFTAALYGGHSGVELTAELLSARTWNRRRGVYFWGKPYEFWQPHRTAETLDAFVADTIKVLSHSTEIHQTRRFLWWSFVCRVHLDDEGEALVGRRLTAPAFNVPRIGLRLRKVYRSPPVPACSS